MRLTDIAESARITKQSVGEIVTDLEKLGYVERIADPEDKCAKLVRLTPRGQEVQDAAVATFAPTSRPSGESGSARRRSRRYELLSRSSRFFPRLCCRARPSFGAGSTPCRNWPV